MMLSDFLRARDDAEEGIGVAHPFSDGSGHMYSKDFSESSRSPTEEISEKFPRPRCSDDYECFEYECECWRDAIVEATRGVVLHENLSMFFRRPIRQNWYYDANGFRIGPLQQMQMEETDILQLQLNENSTFDNLVSNRQLKMNMWMMVNNPWIGWALPKMPVPEMFDSYQEFEKSSKNWFDVSRRLVRAKVMNFNRQKNEINNESCENVDDNLEKFVFHPLEMNILPINGKTDNESLKQNIKNDMYIKRNDFLSRIKKDQTFNNDNINIFIKLQNSYNNGFSMSVGDVCADSIIEASVYGCCQKNIVNPPVMISDDFEYISIVRLSQLLGLDFKCLSSKDKRSIFETCIQLIRNSDTLPSLFSKVPFLYKMAMVFLEFSPEPFELIDPKIDCLQNLSLFVYHKALFRLYFTDVIYKVLFQRKNIDVANKIKSYLDKMFIDFYQYFEKEPFYFDFQSNLFNQATSPTNIMLKTTESSENLLKSNSNSWKFDCNDSYPKSYSFKPRSFYDSSLESDEIDFLSSLEEPIIDFPKSSEFCNNEDNDSAVLISMYLVAFYFNVTNVICNNCFSFLFYILENSTKWYKYFVRKIIANKNLMIHFLKRVFNNESINYFCSIDSIKFLTMLLTIKPSLTGSLPLSNSGWVFSIISKAAQFLNVSLDCANLIYIIIRFTLDFNFLNSNQKKRINIDCIQIQAILAAFIPFEEHKNLLIMELKSFSYLSIDKNALDFFKNPELSNKVLLHLNNKNSHIRYYSWKILENLFKFHPFEISSLLKLPEFREILKGTLFNCNFCVAIEMIKLLNNLLKVFLKDNNFINTKYMKSFNHILKFLNECEFSISKVISQFKRNSKNVSETTYYKNIIKKFNAFTRVSPSLSKLLDENDPNHSSLQAKRVQNLIKEHTLWKKITL